MPPYQTFEEFVAYAKENPGVAIGDSGAGTIPQPWRQRP